MAVSVPRTISPREFLARFGLVLAGLAVLFVVLAVVVAVLAYGTGAKRSGEVEVDGLTSPVTVGWPEEGLPVVSAQTPEGLYAGLGYVHASDATWAMVLWRQAALGELAGWFPARSGLDRHARALGFGVSARRAYDALDAPQRALLDSYARGVNAALAVPGVAQRDEFVLLDVRPEPWQPWHALAVERLLAWLATPPPHADSGFAAAMRADVNVERFAQADSAFRAYLQLGGFQQARAYTGRLAGDVPFFAVSQPWGSSAVPLFEEVALELGGRRVTAATVPGTLALPYGQDDTRAWAALLSGTYRLRPDPTEPPPAISDRLVDRVGDETLLTFNRTPTYLYLPAEPRPAPPPPTSPPGTPVPLDSLVKADSASTKPPATGAAASGTTATRPTPTAGAGTPPRTPAQPAPRTAAPATAPSPRSAAPTDSADAPPPDTTAAPRDGWRLEWAGFGAETDLTAWTDLFAGRQPTFRLFRGAGLTATRDGETQLLGTPVVRTEVPGGLFVAESRDARYAAQRLTGLLRSPRPPGSVSLLLDDSYSPWAAARVGSLSASLGRRETIPDSLRDAYAFLRGWDARYDPDAIGASIFELWLDTHREATGELPRATADSLERRELRRTLGLAVTRLKARHGTEPSGWRWAIVQHGTLQFPIWASDDARRASERYAPVEPEMGGHPTTLRAGPSLVLRGGAAGVWEAWTTGSSWGVTAVRHPGVETRGFLRRARETGHTLRPVLYRRDVQPERTLTLVPVAE